MKGRDKIKKKELFVIIWSGRQERKLLKINFD